MRYTPFATCGPIPPATPKPAPKTERRKPGAPKPGPGSQPEKRHPQAAVIQAFAQVPDATIAALMLQSGGRGAVLPNSGELAIRRIDFTRWLETRPNETFRDWRDAWRAFVVSLSAPPRAQTAPPPFNPIPVPDLPPAPAPAPAAPVAPLPALPSPLPTHFSPSATLDRWRARLAQRQPQPA